MRPGRSNYDYRYPDWMTDSNKEEMAGRPERGNDIDLSSLGFDQVPSLNPSNRQVETVENMTYRRMLAAVLYLLGAAMIGVGVWNLSQEFFILAMGIVVYITGILLGFE